MVLLSATKLSLSILERWAGATFRNRRETAVSHRSLIEVAPARARVLCPRADCLGENDERFRYCQWCAQPCTELRKTTHKVPMEVDEKAVARRYREFREDVLSTPTIKSRCATTARFIDFLQSRKSGRAVPLEDAQPRDVVEYLCFLDSCGRGRRTVVHDRECSAVGTDSLAECSTKSGECGKRFAHESLRTNHVSKLAMMFEKDAGCTHDWNSQSRTGNPVKSDLVAQYMRFTTKQQKRAGVLVKQAPAMLRSHLSKIFGPMRATRDSRAPVFERLVLARDVAFFAVAFSTTKRGDELVNTLIQRILRLPNRSGLLFNFQWGKTMRSGADHVLAVEYNSDCIALCPVRAVERYVEIARSVGWNMDSGYLFPTVSPGTDGGPPVRGRKPVSASEMTAALKGYTKEVGIDQEFTVHSFRAGGAITQALDGQSLESIMQRAYWKNPRTAWRYMRLMQVVSPGSGIEGMVQGVTEEQFRELNEFPLSEQSRSWSAFGNAPML